MKKIITLSLVLSMNTNYLHTWNKDNEPFSSKIYSMFYHDFTPCDDTQEKIIQKELDELTEKSAYEIQRLKKNYEAVKIELLNEIEESKKRTLKQHIYNISYTGFCIILGILFKSSLNSIHNL